MGSADFKRHEQILGRRVLQLGMEVIDHLWLLSRSLTAPTEKQTRLDGEKWNVGAEVELLSPQLFEFLVSMNCTGPNDDSLRHKLDLCCLGGAGGGVVEDPIGPPALFTAEQTAAQFILCSINS